MELVAWYAWCMSDAALSQLCPAVSRRRGVVEVRSAALRTEFALHPPRGAGTGAGLAPSIIFASAPKRRRKNAAGRSSSSRRTLARRSNPLGRKKKLLRTASGSNTSEAKKRRATSVSHRYSSTEAKVQLYIAHDDGGSFKRSTRCRPRAQTPQSGWCRSDCAHACRAPCIARPSVLFLRPGSARARARCNKTLPETPAGRRSLARYQTPSQSTHCQNTSAQTAR